MKFSERNNLSPKRSIQIDSISSELKNRLWNLVTEYIFYFDDFKLNDWIQYRAFVLSTWKSFFKHDIDRLNLDDLSQFKHEVKKWFIFSPWYRPYDIIEFIVANYGILNNDSFAKKCNEILRQELSGYRFMDGIFVAVTNDSELKSIEESLESTNNNTLSAANFHLRIALTKLSDRKMPDYRNSIKESISAVEALVKIITNSPNATLGDGLKKLKQTIQIHPALEKGFLNIYGYTSDGDGIRHAMMEESKLDFEDAKYMLVSCSAFINYLIEKAQKAGIKLN